MTDRKAFYCPHGVDVTPRLRTVLEDGAQKQLYEQNECRKCTADFGHIVLFNVAQMETVR